MAKSKAGKAFKIIGLIVLLIVIFCVLSLFGIFNVKSSWFTEEQHLKRISNRVEKKYIKGDYTLRLYDEDGSSYKSYKATGFDIYPLYNADDELEYALIEFEPYGYTYVIISEKQILGLINVFNVGTSMYSISSLYGENAWLPYSSYDTDGEPIYLTDSNGQIKYTDNPYIVRGVENEKRYLLEYYHCNGDLKPYFIPATKKDGKFINLISNIVVPVRDGKAVGVQAYQQELRFRTLKIFDL